MCKTSKVLLSVGQALFALCLEGMAQLHIGIKVVTNDVYQLDPLIVECSVTNTNQFDIECFPLSLRDMRVRLEVKFPRATEFARVISVDDIGSASDEVVYRPGVTTTEYKSYGCCNSSDESRSGYLLTDPGTYSVRVVGEMSRHRLTNETVLSWQMKRGTKLTSDTVELTVGKREDRALIGIAGIEWRKVECVVQEFHLDGYDLVRLSRNATNGLLARHVALVHESARWTRDTTVKEVYDKVGAINGRVDTVLSRAMLSLLQDRFAGNKWDRLAVEVEQLNGLFPPTKLRRRDDL